MKYIKQALESRMAAFVFFSSLASVVSLFGWAAEKYLQFVPENIAIISFAVIGCTFLFALFLLISSFVSHEKIKELQGDYKLSHRITHHLRDAISALRDLEFEALEKIEISDREADFLQIKENDYLKTTSILHDFGANVASAVADQIKNYFLTNKMYENVRVTIKSLIPSGENQLDWEIKTDLVDHNTWNADFRRLDKNKMEKHLIRNNSDFEGILLGKNKVFFHNNLRSISTDEYKNSSPDWRDRYNSTMIVPIKSKPDGKLNPVFYGFLTADSLNGKNKELFSNDIDAPVLNIMAHAADALAAWYIKNDDHVQTLNDAFAQRTGILAMADYIKNNKIAESR